MSTQLNVTELDFDQIKENIKTYFKRQDSEFKDWDFDGSGLNTLIDVLAYNTHYNAVNAHVTLNESFLDSAQVRSNVVARAKLLGYTPSSVTAPFASVAMTFTGSAQATVTDTMSISRGATFSGSIDGITYSFITLETYNAPATLSSNGNIEFVFPAVTIYEGNLVTRRFDVNVNNANQKFVLADSKIDTSQMTVKVYENPNSTLSTAYSKFESFNSIGPQATVYFLYENHQEYFQVEFGDGVLGKKLTGTNIVEIEYLQTTGSEANNIQSFTYSGTLPAVASVLKSIQTTSKSSGGAIKESIASIKHKAPLSFISQNRAVSASDYTAIISKQFTNLQSLSVWGGEYNVPVKYGRVMISAKPYNADTLTDLEKERLLSILSSKKVIAIQPEIVDPELLYIYVTLLFKYDANATTLSRGELESQVTNTIENYNLDTLEKFEGIFRYSNFLNLVDSYNSAIVSSNANIFCYKNLTLVKGGTSIQEITFDIPMGTSASQEGKIIESDSYSYNGVSIFIRDERPVSGTVRNLYTYRIIGGVESRLTPTVGSFDADTGVVRLNPLLVDKTSVVKIKGAPRSNDIVAKRNKILSIDTAASIITGEVDTIAVAGDTGKTTYNTFNRQ